MRRRFAGILLVAGFATAADTAAGSSLVAASKRPTDVTVKVEGASRRVPDSFLGFSVEVSELPGYVRAGAVFDRALSLLRSGWGAPLFLRVAGRSGDDALWGIPAQSMPPRTFAIGDEWLGQLAGLARRDRLRVTVGLNLAVHSPSMAASLARAVYDALGPGLLAGFAVGNEPDLYQRQPGLEAERISSGSSLAPAHWTRDYSASRYRRDYRAYARSLATAVPGVGLDGPETTDVKPVWLAAVRGLGRLGPRSLTVHRYPSSSCWEQSSPLYPRVSVLLRESSSAGLAARVRAAAAMAQKTGVLLRVSETNSASCGGVWGVSDSFAAALWAPDVLFEFIRAGVDGVNWHIRPLMPNAPFELRGDAIEPMPEFYGLALFAQMVGPQARRVNVQISCPAGLRMKVWAVRSRSRASVLLINKGARAASVSLRAPAAGVEARVERLSAPSISARTGVRLAGQWIGSDGRWHGRRVMAILRPRGGNYYVRVPRYSAALVQTPRP